jgi:hypothetical protein
MKSRLAKLTIRYANRLVTYTCQSVAHADLLRSRMLTLYGNASITSAWIE